jgi:hypothetical protein
MIVAITFSILTFILGVQLIIKFTTNELDRPYRIIKRQYYDVGKLKNEYYVVQKQKQFLFIKYWSGVECEDSWDTTNVPSFENFDEAYTLLQKCKQQKPLNGFKDVVEVEWTKYPMKIN